MPFANGGKNLMLDNLGTLYAALFNGDPESGGTEATGGSPAYARKAVTWDGAASGGSRSASNTDPVFDVPNGFTVAWVAYYTASSGGTLIAKHDVTNEVYGAQGTYTLTSQTFSIS
jgi:hypothetical protein